LEGKAWRGNRGGVCCFVAGHIDVSVATCGMNFQTGALPPFTGIIKIAY
jgi:hypothetical protein